MIPSVKIITPAIVMVLLIGCSSNWDTASTKAMQGKDAFGNALKDQYVTLSEIEQAEADWSDAAYFNNKARLAAMGSVVIPTKIKERSLPKDKISELTDARSELMNMLSDGRNNDPETAARAQTMFDCWIQEQEENFQLEDINKCRDGFYAAMNKPGSMSHRQTSQSKTFIVYFGFNTATLNKTARDVIKQAIAYAKEINAVSLHISGYTDTTGPSNYNVDLSQKRAHVVLHALPKNMNTNVNAYGERKQAVATEDEVNKSANRRVEIKIIK